MNRIYSLLGNFESNIDTNLYQGGYPANTEDVKKAGFDVIVLAAAELQPENDEEVKTLFKGVKVICAPMEDSDDGPTSDEVSIALKAAGFVVKAIKSGKKVLITCVAGRNRSGLISALVLVSLYGMTGHDAAEHVRAKRKNALTNTGFSEFLDTI